MMAIDMKWDDRQIEKIIQHWFKMIGRELAKPAVPPENVYMDETGALLNVLSARKVLVGKENRRKNRAEQ